MSAAMISLKRVGYTQFCISWMITSSCEIGFPVHWSERVPPPAYTAAVQTMFTLFYMRRLRRAEIQYVKNKPTSARVPFREKFRRFK